MRGVVKVMVVIMILQAILTTSVFATQPRAVACPNCNGGGLVETVGAPYNKSTYIPCMQHPGFSMVQVVKARDRTLKCNRCGYSEHYTEQIGDSVIDFYCTSGKAHGTG